MTQPAKPAKNEKARLERLKKLMILDSAAEPFFDEITQLASQICNTPIALISLIDENRQWFKANVGFEGAAETHRDIAFCTHAILEDQLFEVEDATQDSRFKNNPLVTSKPNIRFYAGMPLMLPDGFNIGTLCVIDTRPKQLNNAQKQMLEKLSSIASKALLLREHGIHEAQSKASILAAIVESSKDAILSKTLDGIVTSWNEAAEKLFGFSGEEIIGKTINELIPLDKRHEEGVFVERIKNNQTIKHFETERISKNKKRVQISVSLSPIKNLHGEVIGISTIASDISEIKKLQQTIANKHEHLRVTMDSIGDAVITTDKLGQVQYLNPIAENLTGWGNKAAIGLPLHEVFNIVNETSRIPCLNPVEQCLAKDCVIGLSSNTTLISRNGKEYGIEDTAAPIRDDEGKTIGVVLVFHDVSAQRIMAKEITYRATHDSLTDLINRSEFEVLLNQFINNYREPGILNSLMFIDLDQFKIVNDTCGHSAGDKLLQEISKTIKSCIRTSDIFARIGGDEFAIILPKCDTEKSLKIANAICKVVDRYRFVYDGQRFRIGASIGLVMIDSHWSSITSLLQAADHACYKAKHAGRNRVHLHYNEDNAYETNKNEAHWANRIEAALEENRFELFCQRIVPLNHAGLEHAEILLRLKDETGKYISPDLFLPSAERFHMMSRIDRWVVKEALAWMQKNISQLTHIESISINLSGQSLNDKTFHKYVAHLIDCVDFDHSKICFEITETVAITNISDAIHFLNLLKQYGIKFSLDDFGSGVSSFGYLKSLPVDYLKIDGQFIKDLTDNKIGQATVKCIVEVAKITHKKTIAEWVENDTVERILKGMGVDFVQGYLKHMPAPTDCILQDNINNATSANKNFVA
jgi:diguanylate cyclase (GGDEF)-like protein/PAS domain S-box-containing protein